MLTPGLVVTFLTFSEGKLFFFFTIEADIAALYGYILLHLLQ